MVESATAPPGTHPASRPDARPSRGRRVLVWALLVAASLLGLLTVLTLWAERQVLDDEQWRVSTEEMVLNPEVRAAVSQYVVDELYERVDVAAALAERLPPTLDPLAPTIAASVRQPAVEAVDSLLARPRLQQAWINASGLAHEKLMNVLRNETGFGIETGDGTVTLDLRELVTEIGLQLGLSGERLAQLPEGTGVITVMASDQLSAAQQVVRVIDLLSVWMFVLVLVLYAVALVIARGARREILRNIGWAFVLVGLLTLVARELAGNYVVGSLTTRANEATGERVWLISTSVLGDIGWACVLYGSVAVAGAALAGPHRAAVAVRRRLAPVMTQRPGFVWAGLAAAYLLVILWGGTHALRTWWGILLLGALLVLGLVALQRQLRRELRAAATQPPAARGVDGDGGAGGLDAGNGELALGSTPNT